MPPPPVAVNSSDVADDNDALASMLMAWYLSGYHTGYYQVSCYSNAQICTDSGIFYKYSLHFTISLYYFCPRSGFVFFEVAHLTFKQLC